jgi:cell division protein FtsI/penicillin-binding protein 2
VRPHTAFSSLAGRLRPDALTRTARSFGLGRRLSPGLPSSDLPPTHAWFIAYRDDVAVAVLVDCGRAGGEVAASIAARFLERLASR